MTRPPRRMSRQHARAGDEDRLLPLVNIVFLLLIFFMVAGQLTAADPFEIVPPRSASEGEASVEDPLIAVGADGSLALDNVVMAEPAMLEALAGRRVSSLRIKADGRLPAFELVALMERLRGAGFASIRLLTVIDRDGA
ncbi:MAG: biopolymer transporter ExbD [Pseudomonadota bacterium]